MTSTTTRSPGGLPLREKIAYGFGDLGTGFMFDLGQAYLLKFYTDVAGLPATTAAEIFVVTKLFDACVDPFAGAFVDGRTRVGRFGRFRPFLVWATLPLAVLTVLIFLTPGLSSGVDLAYAYVSYMLWGVAYAFSNAPYGSLASVMTQDNAERAQLASFRQAGSVAALLLSGALFMPVVLAFGGGRTGYAAAAAAMAVAGWLSFLVSFAGTRERIPVVRAEKLTVHGWGRAVLGNRALLALIAMTLFSISAYNIKTAMIAYYTEYVLGDIRLLAWVNVVSIGASVVGVVTMPWLAARIGKRGTALLGFGVAAAADGLNFVFGHDLVVFTVLLSVSFVGVALPNGITWAMVSDTIDYGHWRTGARREGITYSVFNFSRKVAQSLAGGMAGFGLAAVGYVANAEQTAATQWGIRALQTLYPCLALVLAAVALRLLYPLSDARVRQIVAEVHAREAHLDARPGA